MTTHARPFIDFSTFPDSDGEPMAENEDNLVQMTDLIFTLAYLLEPRGHKVGGNILMYYNPANGWDHLAPDVYVALNVPTHRQRMWQTWVEGKFPEVVFDHLTQHPGSRPERETRSLCPARRGGILHL